MTNTLAKAHATINEEKRQRMAACWEELQAVLEKHRCALDAVPQFTGTAGVFSVVVKIRVSAREG